MSDATIDPIVVGGVAEHDVDRQGRSATDREARLRDGADELRHKRVLSLLDRPNLLIGVAATLMTIGLSLIILGWVGASRSIYLEEQVPYLISGGIFGGALAVIGAVTLFTHWLTVSIREARARDQRHDQQHAEVLAALERLADLREGGPNGDARGHRPERPLRAAPRGS